MLKITLLIAALLSQTVALAGAHQAQSVEPVLNVVTDNWAPYVNAPGEQRGAASVHLAMILAELGWQADTQYLPYDQSARLVEQGKVDMAYPFFRTAAREQRLLFSLPILRVSNRLYFNRQFNQELSMEQLPELRLGRVSGYSYGAVVDGFVKQARVYPDERSALLALFANQIDVLPMTAGVMAHTLQTHFPERLQLVKAMSGLDESAGLHIVAAKSPAGEQLIAQIDAVIRGFERDGIASFNQQVVSVPAVPLDLAQLVSTDDYPIIIAQDSRGEQAQFFTLPNGTRVAVLQWGPKILQPSQSDRLYRNMTDLSQVVVLNGPHLGKELFVKNLYIQMD